jgi:hypothetical protein
VKIELPIVVDARVVEPVTAKEVVAVRTPNVPVFPSVVEANKFVTLEVVALVVEAFRVRKLPVVPHNVVIVAVIAFKIFDQRD